MNQQTVPTLVHLTWQCTDATQTVRFLSDLFGWTFEDRGDRYFVARPPSGPWIGVTEVETIRHGNEFIPHISVRDLDGVVSNAVSLGAIIVERGRIPGAGRFVDLTDPDGTRFTVIEFDAGKSQPH